MDAMIKPISVYILLVLIIPFIASQKCGSDDECSRHWPQATCTRGRCRCPIDTVRKKSPSREWVCLSVKDAATGESGPPLTCPLPEGAGYQVILRNESAPVQCSTRVENSCPAGYECIQGLSTFGSLDGICCPDPDTTCSHAIFDNDEGTIDRWGFDGKQCVLFKWHPDRPSSPNNFRTKIHCEDYCIKHVKYAFEDI
ncbi:unnamed protein product [Auanema sp. JU1783]|nr:unnamed protein product [Auanema sp. JU1783]